MFTETKHRFMKYKFSDISFIFNETNEKYNEII